MTWGSRSQAKKSLWIGGARQHYGRVPVEAELLLMIKGPLVTQAEKSSSDPRWKKGDTEAGLEVALHHGCRIPSPQKTLGLALLLHRPPLPTAS